MTQKNNWLFWKKKSAQTPPEKPKTAAHSPLNSKLDSLADSAPLGSDKPGHRPEAQKPEAPKPEPAQIKALEGDTQNTDIPKNEASQNWLTRLRQALSKSANLVGGKLNALFTGKRLDDDLLASLEDHLIEADMGAPMASKLTAKLRAERYGHETDTDAVKHLLISEITALLAPLSKPLSIKPDHKPHVILMAGVNGAGKTTTIGKMAKQYRDQGLKILLAAGDTFRAAGGTQLEVWAKRIGVDIITKPSGSDAAALAYEALDKAIDSQADILLIDTAGRLQNREELMAELAKIIRVLDKKMPGCPHDRLLVLDATTGQNALHQIEIFQKIAGITGLIMTKLDGSARGGVLIAAADRFQLPIHLIGIGEAVEDLAPFKPEDFAKSLFEQA